MADSEPSYKRQRLAASASATDATTVDQQQSPWVTSLFQVPAGLPRAPSPGAMHGCRIAAWTAPGDDQSSYGSVLASGRNVFWSQLQLLQQQLQTEQQGKEGVLLPLRVQSRAVQQLQQLPQHAGEVQSLALVPHPDQAAAGDMLLATVDAFGAGGISRLRPALEYAAVDTTSKAGAPAAAAASPTSPPEVLVHSRLQPLDPNKEGGWAGVCFSCSSKTGAAAASGPLLLATARSFAKDVTVYDASNGTALRSFGCVMNPYALNFLPSSILSSSDANLLAVAEGHLVSLWDVRAAGAAAGCVQRVTPGNRGQALYTLSWCKAEGGLLGSAGAERSLFMAEPRKWRVLHKWNGATRLAIHGLSFLDVDPRFAVLAGLDLEVLCGRWDKPGSSSRPFTSTGPVAGEETAAAAGPARGAPGAPGSGDRSRKGAAAAAVAAGAATAPAAAVGDGGEGGGGGGAAAGVFSFRGDGRWLGVSKAAGADVLAGYAASGNLVYARIG